LSALTLSRRRARLFVVLATIAGVVLPVWTVRYIPGTDLPSHLAIANIVAKLVSGDPVITQFYAINLQPFPYYLVYVVLAPLVAWCGPLLAAKLFCSAIAMATALACHRLFRLLAAPWWSALAAVFLTYGMIFFWGFLPTLVGVPVYIAGLAELVALARGERRSPLTATLAGLVLMVTHIALAVPWGCALVAMWTTRDRRIVRASLTIGAASFLPLLPMLLTRLLTAHVSYAFNAQYEAPAIFARHVMAQFGVFDRGLGLATHLLFLGGAAVLALLHRRSGAIATPVVRMIGAFAALAVAAYAATPMAMELGGDAIWAFNVRLFFVAELAVLAWLTVDRDSEPRAIQLTQPLLAGAHLAAMIGFFAAFDAQVRAAEPVLAAIPEGTRLAVASKDGRFGEAWPPQLLHIHGYYLATRGGYDGAVFAGKHIPIRSVQPFCLGNMEAPAENDCDLLFAEGSAVSPALASCTPMIVSGAFALVRDCGRKDAPPEVSPARSAATIGR
jgi:hypothetical protein